jgi:hypothetical protein
MNVNGSALHAYPDIVQAAAERKWELVGHGFTQRNMQKVANEREDIRNTAEAIGKVTGKRPRGWLGPGLTETWETPDILKEEGYDYVADWVLDDQPVWLKTRGKPIVSIPYTQECNDVANGTMRTAGLIDIPAARCVALTADGAHNSGSLSADEAKDFMLSVLSGPERKLVDAARDSADLTREELASRTVYAPGSGGFNNLIGSLCGLNIFVKPRAGSVAPSDRARHLIEA